MGKHKAEMQDASDRISPDSPAQDAARFFGRRPRTNNNRRQGRQAGFLVIEEARRSALDLFTVRPLVT
jgi:hypothetical protein